MKKYYPIEEQINECYAFLGISKKDARDMNEAEMEECEIELGKSFEWVDHPMCYQRVPKHIDTGKIIW